MAPMVGADLEQMTRLQTAMIDRASELQNILSGIDSALCRVGWEGLDANRFRSEWANRCKRDLLRLIAALNDCAEALKEQAREQADASSSKSGSAPSGTRNPGIVTNEASSASGGGAKEAAGGVVGESAARKQAADDFVAKWEGKKIDADNAYGAQCFDVFRQYSNEVVGARSGIARNGGNAAFNIYNNYDTNGCNEYYDRIPADQGIPQAGDIVVIGPRGNWDKYGHVALVTNGPEDGTIKILEQNYNPPYNGSDPAAVHDLSLSNRHILGYLRPKTVR